MHEQTASKQNPNDPLTPGSSSAATDSATADELFYEAVSLAAGCGANPTQLLTVALSAIRADTLDDALDQLLARRATIARAAAETPVPHRELAAPPVGPWRARIRRDIDDHEIRDQLLYGTLLGKKNFLQVAALSIGGVELSDSDARLVDEIAVIFQLADPRIWPLAVTRRIGRLGQPLGARLTAGIASMFNPFMVSCPTAGFFAVLERIEVALAGGMTLGQWLDDALATKIRIPGVGRPVLRGPDERFALSVAAAHKYQRGDGANLAVIVELNELLIERKGLHLNGAAVFAAIMRDLGFSAPALAAMMQLFFMVPVLTQATVEPEAPE